MKNRMCKRFIVYVLAAVLSIGHVLPVLAVEGDVQEVSQVQMPAAEMKGIDISEAGVEQVTVTAEEFKVKFQVDEADMVSSVEEMNAELQMQHAEEEFVSENSVSFNDAGITAEGATYATTEDAADYIRARLLKRKETASIRIVSTKSALSKNLSKILNEVFAYDINGAPNEGDYLYWHMAGYGLTDDVEKNSDGTYTICLGFLYRSTLEEEKFVTSKVKSIINQYNLRSSALNDYQKVRIIYDYIMGLITYDYYNYYNNPGYEPMYTAYGALDSGYAVCQAYATLFYRLSEEAGLSARVICGNDENGVPTHGWNIVKIGTLYYNLDATWDDGTTPPTHIYFLKNMADFKGHQRNARHTGSAFDKAFPTAAVSYPLPEEVTVAAQGTVSGVVAKQQKNNTVKVSWNAYAGTGSYLVYRKEAGGQYCCIGSTNGTSYTDVITPKKTYVYRVYSMSGGKEIAKSGEVQVKTAVKLLKKGKVYKVDGYKYKVLKSTSKTKTVSFHGVTSKKLTTVIIPDSVEIDGLKYKVTEISSGALKNHKKVKTVSVGANVTKIGSKAFYKAKKLTNIVVKGKKLKSVGKNALSGISSKAVIRVPSSKLKKYKKLFNGKGQKSTVKIKK